MKSQTQIFRPSKWKNVGLFLGCSVFVAGAYFMLEDEPLMGWLCISFFGLGVVVSLLQFLTNYPCLILNEEGFEIKGLLRTNFTKWSEVKNFRQGHINGNKMIFFDYTQKHKKGKRGKKLAKFLSGNEGAIQSTYTIKTKELLKLIKAYKLKSK